MKNEVPWVRVIMNIFRTADLLYDSVTVYSIQGSVWHSSTFDLSMKLVIK
jgi:hypothetical protein